MPTVGARTEGTTNCIAKKRPAKNDKGSKMELGSAHLWLWQGEARALEAVLAADPEELGAIGPDRDLDALHRHVATAGAEHLGGTLLLGDVEAGVTAEGPAGQPGGTRGGEGGQLGLGY